MCASPWGGHSDVGVAAAALLVQRLGWLDAEWTAVVEGASKAMDVAERFTDGGPHAGGGGDDLRRRVRVILRLGGGVGRAAGDTAPAAGPARAAAAAVEGVGGDAAAAQCTPTWPPTTPGTATAVGATAVGGANAAGAPDRGLLAADRPAATGSGAAKCIGTGAYA